jgi:hypothetical protein
MTARRHRRNPENLEAVIRRDQLVRFDSTAEEFPVALANRYTDLKAAGRI